MKKEVLNELYYEQILLDELSQEKFKREDINQDKIRILKQSNKSILDKYPPEFWANTIEDKLQKEKKNNKMNFSSARLYIPLSAAAVFLLFFTISPIFDKMESFANPNEFENIRLKGNTPSIFIYRGNGNDAELLDNNALVKEKDLLQISYDSAGEKYGIIFSIDGRGTVTLHFPDNINSDTKLENGGKVSLPFSYELDNAPLFERFFFVTSNNEINAQSILDNAGSIAKGNKSEMLNLADGSKQQSVILYKEEDQ